ncbi:MAG: Ig-like domain-containing protein [Deltaproteobacteria bacterium]|nr:Ig-like domain-containing protein [Nannocystaceae bacterium]
MDCRRLVAVLSLAGVAALPGVARAERTIFVNLGAQAINDAGGNDPAMNSFSTGNFNGGTTDGWGALTEAQRAELLFWLKEGTVPFDIHFTFERPAAGTYDMIAFGSAADAAELFADIGCPPAVGLSDCEDADAEDISFMFWGCMPAAQQDDMQRIAFNALTGAGFGWGLENLTSSGQIMGSYTLGGVEFGEECTPIDGTPACMHGGCTAGLQSSATDVEARFGARVDDGPPVVTITAPADLSVTGTDVSVTADVTDEFGGLAVELEVVEAMGQSLADDLPPYEWNLQNVPEGMWTLRLTATDADLNVVTQEIVVCVGGEDCPLAGTGSSSGGASSSDGGEQTSSTGGDSSSDDAGTTTGTEGGGSIPPPMTTTALTGGFGDDGAATGCGCTSDRPHRSGWALLGLGLLALRRRRG